MPCRLPRLTWFAGIVIVSSLSIPAFGQEVRYDFRPVKLLEPQPPIEKFPVKRMAEVGRELGTSEMVIGVTIGEESRAYPINMLTGPRREILNDTLGGRAIAATW